MDLLTDHVVIFRDGGNALVLDTDGTPREGPVSRDGSVIPNKVEFPPVTEPDEAVEEAEEALRGKK